MKISTNEDLKDPELQRIASGITQQTQKQELRYDNDRQRACHQVFKTSKYKQFKENNPDRAPGTCIWVLSHPKYLEWWRRPKDDLLWISADPGCGKSVLSKSLLNHDFQSVDTLTTCYFFFKDNDEQNSLAIALCAILHQLFTRQPQLLRHAMPAWERNGEKLQQEVSELWRILHAAATDSVAGNVICVLDALDECQPRDRQVLIQNLSSFYSVSSSVRPKGTLKFLVTSRPYDDIEVGFQDIPSSLPAIRLSGEMENDQIQREIDLVVRHRVAKLAEDNKLNLRTRQDLERRLLAMQNRTYLWLHLAIEAIDHKYRNSLHPDSESIESLPSSVEDAYEKLLSEIQTTERETVTTLFHMIIGARRPLTTAEMAVAFGIYRDARVDKDLLEGRIRHLCGLFVFINHSRIYLIHQTAREFLINQGGTHEGHSGWRHCLDPIHSEKIMVGVCVQYLLQDEFQHKAHDLSQEMLERYAMSDEEEETCHVDLSAFLVYSARHWPAHFRSAHIDINDPLMTKVCRLYWAEDEYYTLWFNILWKSLRPYLYKPTMNTTGLAAFNGHETVLTLLMETEEVDANSRDEQGCTALYWAAQQGHQAAAQLLLERGADVNAESGYYGNALQAASSGGHEKVVELLLEKGADVNAQGGEYGTALQAASPEGHEEMMRLLLEKGADVNAQGGKYGNALQMASLRGHEKAVELLLENGADVNAQGGQYRNALCAASFWGRETVVELLVEKGADVNAQGGMYGTALYEASLGGEVEVVKLLLEKGAEVNAQSGNYGNALQGASEGGHDEVVELLVEKGAEVNAQGGQYGNALCAASFWGRETVVELLLEKGAKVNAQGGKYYNALQAASLGCYVTVMQLLLEKGAEVNAQGGEYGNALQAASLGGHDKAVRLLLEQGAEVNAQGGLYGNALQAASLRGHDKVVRLLLEQGAEVNAQGGLYGNALQAALSEDHEEMVQLLLEKGADVSAQGGEYGTAVQVASSEGHEEVARLFQEKGTDANPQGEDEEERGENDNFKDRGIHAIQRPSAATDGNLALQDYRMQLWLLEEQNTKRLIVARRRDKALERRRDRSRAR